jgi:hypothetical protein
MWLQARSSEFKIRKEIESSSSYINNKGEFPEKYFCINPKRIIFDNSDLKDGYWKFLPEVDKEIKSDFLLLIEIYDDPIIILS